MLSVSSAVGSGQVVELPECIKAGERGNGQSEVLPDGMNKPPEAPSKQAPPARSLVALRTDGVYLVGIEDGEGRDFTGREMVTFLVLNPEENALAKARLEDAEGELIAHVLGRLPKR